MDQSLAQPTDSGTQRNVRCMIFFAETSQLKNLESGRSWVWPLPSNSDHQDYYIFRRECRTKPLFATGILGRGHTQGRSIYIRYFELGTINLYRSKHIFSIENPPKM